MKLWHEEFYSREKMSFEPYKGNKGKVNSLIGELIQQIEEKCWFLRILGVLAQYKRRYVTELLLV
jgi:hypothetical protein